MPRVLDTNCLTVTKLERVREALYERNVFVKWRDSLELKDGRDLLNDEIASKLKVNWQWGSATSEYPIITRAIQDAIRENIKDLAQTALNLLEQEYQDALNDITTDATEG